MTILHISSFFDKATVVVLAFVSSIVRIAYHVQEL